MLPNPHYSPFLPFVNPFYQFDHHVPAFIITCVVARLTFFLNPNSHKHININEADKRHKAKTYQPKTSWATIKTKRTYS